MADSWLPFPPGGIMSRATGTRRKNGVENNTGETTDLAIWMKWCQWCLMSLMSEKITVITWNDMRYDMKILVFKSFNILKHSQVGAQDLKDYRKDIWHLVRFFCKRKRIAYACDLLSSFTRDGSTKSFQRPIVASKSIWQNPLTCIVLCRPSNIPAKHPNPYRHQSSYSQMMIGVYNHLRNARYLGSITIFSFGEPGSLGI